MQSRNRSRRYGWAPRALVVLSCALALWASQPSSAHAAHAASKPALLKQDAGGELRGGVEIAQPTVRPIRESRMTGIHAESFFASAQRFRMLATFEIFQRLLIAELQPVQHGMMPAFCLDAVCIEIISPVAPIAHTHAVVSPPHLSVSDQFFAIGHCLLAPPQV